MTTEIQAADASSSSALVETQNQAVEKFDYLRFAMEQKYPPDLLREYMALYREQEAVKAEVEFNKAMAGLQGEAGPVIKTKMVTGKINFAYASYDDVMDVYAPLLKKYKMSVMFSTPSSEGGVMQMTIRVGHSGGHTFVSTMPVPFADVNISSIQKFGATNSYGRRYAFINAFNAVTAGEDDESKLESELIGESQIKLIEQKIREAEQIGDPIDMVKFLKWRKVESIDQIKDADFNDVITKMESKIREAAINKKVAELKNEKQGDSI